MRILGIDPGLADMGWGVVESQGTRLSCLGYGTISTKADLALSERLRQIHARLLDLIEEWHPELASVETLFFAKNVSSAIPVAQARGAILLSCALCNVRVFELSPLQIKQSIVGIGRADKLQVQHMVQLLLKMQVLPKPDHAADALAAAIALSHGAGGNFDRTIQ